MNGWTLAAILALWCASSALPASAQGTSASTSADSRPAAIGMTGERLSGLERFDRAMVAFMQEHQINRAKPPLTTDHVVRYMLSRPLDVDPGGGFAYSNFGYQMLGTVIETATGNSYERYVREEILRPMGITDMRGGKTLLQDRAPGEVRYYQQTEPRMLPSNMGSNFGEVVPSPYGALTLERLAASGGWLATAVDLARFMTALDPLFELHRRTRSQAGSRSFPSPPLVS